jgi:hypothetical protein
MASRARSCNACWGLRHHIFLHFVEAIANDAIHSLNAEKVMW